MSNEHLEPEDGDNEEQVTSLDPKIAHHSSYIDETKRILQAYTDCESYDELEQMVVEENILNKNTDEYRMNILREITRRHIPSKNEYTETPLIRILSSDVRSDVADWCLYYEFAQDPFIHFMTVEFLYPEFERGTLTVQGEDIVTFIQSIKDDYANLCDRSDETITQAASSYLTALRNFGLLEGIRKKEFAVTYVPDETIAYVVYRLFSEEARTAADVIKHEDWKLFLMDQSEVQRRVRDISPQYINYEKRGSTERLKMKYETIDELIDAF